MKTAIIRKYMPYGAPYSVHVLEYRGKHLMEEIHAADKEGLGCLVEYAINCGFDQIKFIDNTKQQG